jgi:hypothetical protein
MGKVALPRNDATPLRLRTASYASSVSTHALIKDRRDGFRNTGGTGGSSAWELDCHASAAPARQALEGGLTLAEHTEIVSSWLSGRWGNRLMNEYRLFRYVASSDLLAMRWGSHDTAE